MKILLVGGLGYIGGRLAQHLSKNVRHQIFLTTTRDIFPSWAKAYSIEYLDLKDSASIESCLQNVQPDIVIDLAATQQAECQVNEDKAYQINEKGTERLVDLSLKCGVKRFVYFSTFQVYGNFIGKITEKTSTNPKSVYAKSKWLGEEVCRKYQSKDFQTLIFRLSNAFGYPCDNQIADSVWTLAFNAFCKSAIDNGEITIRSNQYRDFICLHDVARAVEYFLTNKEDYWEDGLYNLGGENCLSIKEVAERISVVYESVFEKGSIPIQGPVADKDKVFEPFFYNIDKLKSTGFVLENNIDEEVRQTLLFLKSNMETCENG